jgi:hypothetical protein
MGNECEGWGGTASSCWCLGAPEAVLGATLVLVTLLRSMESWL